MLVFARNNKKCRSLGGFMISFSVLRSVCCVLILSCQLNFLLLQVPDHFNDINDVLRALPALFRFGRTLFILKGVHAADVDEEILEKCDLGLGENSSVVAQRTGFKMFSVSAHCHYSNCFFPAARILRLSEHVRPGQVPRPHGPLGSGRGRANFYAGFRERKTGIGTFGRRTSPGPQTACL